MESMDPMDSMDMPWILCNFHREYLFSTIQLGAWTRSLDQGPVTSGGPRAQLLDGWMAGLAGGGGISIYYAILCTEYV